MKITLSPIVSHQPVTPPVVSVDGLLLTVGDTTIDLSQIPEGGQAEADENSPLIGVCTREAVTARYPYSTDVYSPMQPTDPASYVFEIESGMVPCPLIKR